MEAKAVAKFVRISPRKARQVVDLIRGKSVGEAYAILKFTPHKGAALVENVLKSAVANAEHNYNMNVDDLYISTAYVDQGASLKDSNLEQWVEQMVSVKEQAILL